jgi:hypothetical protein
MDTLPGHVPQTPPTGLLEPPDPTLEDNNRSFHCVSFLSLQGPVTWSTHG